MVAPAASSSSRREDTSSSEQRELVRRIVITKDYYEVLGLRKDASEDDLKRAYRKLALKLHPDKCTAQGADEAFKAVSRAFSCLSDADKRAAYDRYGSETPGLTRRHQGGRGPFGAQGEVDPEELFNMFFNGGFGGPFGGGPFGGPGVRVFNTQFGGGGFRRQQQQQQQRPQQPANPIAQLLQFVPILLLLLWTFMQMPSAPVYSLDKTSEYKHQFDTTRLTVPYFVKEPQSYERQYPAAGRERARVEKEVETLYRQRLEHNCYVERSNQQKLYNWGQRERAKNYPLPHCDKLRGLYGLYT